MTKVTAQGELHIVKLSLLTNKELRELQSYLAKSHNLGVDLSARRVPATARSAQRGGTLVVGHSETGHHHVVESPCAELFETTNPLICFLRCEMPTSLDHRKPGDPHQHAPKALEAGDYLITRQRESGPLGWRAVAD